MKGNTGISTSEYKQRATPELATLLDAQWKQAVNEKTITCPCGRPRALEVAYRCLYCGVWFCFTCAELHFGTSYRDWVAKHQGETDAKHGPGKLFVVDYPHEAGTGPDCDGTW